MVFRPYRKLMRIYKSLAVILPKALEKELNWKPGDFVVFEVVDKKTVRITNVTLEERE